MKKAIALTLWFATLSVSSTAAWANHDHHNNRDDVPEVSVPVDQLPAPAKKFLSSRYSKYTIVSCDKRVDGNFHVKVIYLNMFSEERHQDFVFAPDGTLIQG